MSCGMVSYDTMVYAESDISNRVSVDGLVQDCSFSSSGDTAVLL